MSNLKASPVKSAVLLVGFVILVVLVARQVSGGAKEAVADVVDAENLLVEPAGEGDLQSVIAPQVRVPRPKMSKSLARDPFALDWLVIDTNRIDEEDLDIEGDVLLLQLTLTGMDKSGQATAVVSGSVIHVGDRVAEFVVERIEKRSVVLRNGQEIIKLRMP